jgi:hypothetical protein
MSRSLSETVRPVSAGARGDRRAANAPNRRLYDAELLWLVRFLT